MPEKIEKVCDRQCKHCLFGTDPVPGREIALTWLTKLEAAALRCILKKKGVAAFFCHKQDGRGHHEVVCRGWWERRFEYGWSQEDEETEDTKNIKFVPLPEGTIIGEMDWVAENDQERRKKYLFQIDDF